MSDASFQPDEPDLRPRSIQGICTVAAIAAFAAAAYWALLTFLIGISGQSPIQMALPFLLIALYAYRGYQLLQGNVTAAQNLMWLHGIGAAVTVFQVVTEVAAPVLLIVKLVIHAFGLATSIMVVQKAKV
jgi:hypothetical protein